MLITRVDNVYLETDPKAATDSAHEEDTEDDGSSDGPGHYMA
jgi:hypothetical protein